MSGESGMSGLAGAEGKVCGGRAGDTCEPGEFCKFPNGTCGVADETGACSSPPGGVSCAMTRVCGCDGKVHRSACDAYQSGVDVAAGNPCVLGNGDVGDSCLANTDCSGALLCCSSPIGIVSCTTPMGNGCPLTP